MITKYLKKLSKGSTKYNAVGTGRKGVFYKQVVELNNACYFQTGFPDRVSKQGFQVFPDNVKKVCIK